MNIELYNQLFEIANQHINEGTESEQMEGRGMLFVLKHCQPSEPPEFDPEWLNTKRDYAINRLVKELASETAVTETDGICLNDGITILVENESSGKFEYTSAAQEIYDLQYKNAVKRISKFVNDLLKAVNSNLPPKKEAERYYSATQVKWEKAKMVIDESETSIEESVRRIENVNADVLIGYIRGVNLVQGKLINDLHAGDFLRMIQLN